MGQSIPTAISSRLASGSTQRSAADRLWVAEDWAVIAPAAITMGVMLWGITAPSYWADEADTVSAESRSIPELIRLLGHVDAVHGLYYLLIWPLVGLAGPGELTTRLPSAVAMAAAAGGIAAIGRRIAGRRAGLWAGLVFAALPVISGQGHNARPYAMTTAAAVLASYLLVRTGEDPRRHWLIAYGGALALLGYLELFALLLVPAHALALRTMARRNPKPDLTRRWAAPVAAAALAVAPLAVIGWQQRAAISWIHRPGWADVGATLTSLAGGSLALAITVWTVLAFGCWWALASGQNTPPGRRLTALALPWLLLPPAALLAVSQAKPVYNFRYVLFCIPALALLAGLGLARLRPPWRACAAILILALAIPAQMGMRVPGTGMREAGRFLNSREQPGDAIIYPATLIPPWYLVYPSSFARLRDIQMARSPAASGHLYGVSVPVHVLKQREQHTRRIWVVETTPWQSPAGYLSTEFRLLHTWRLEHGHLRIWLYERETLTASLPYLSAARRVRLTVSHSRRSLGPTTQGPCISMRCCWRRELTHLRRAGRQAEPSACYSRRCSFSTVRPVSERIPRSVPLATSRP